MFAAALALLAVAAVCAAPKPKTEEAAVARIASGAAFKLEVRRTPEERALGLMRRDDLPDDRGMLFVFPDDGFHSFWMKNMKISIDIFWLDAEGVVVHVEESVPPCRKDPCPSYKPKKKARYVLELSSGSASRHGLAAGSRFLLEGVERPRR